MTKPTLLHAAIAATFAAALTITPAVQSAPPATAPGLNKLQCFDGTTDGGFGGTCTLTSRGAKGPALLDNTDDDPAGDYAGVYVVESTLIGQPLADVRQLGYHYVGTIEPLPGNLSLNLPLDTTGDGATDGYAFIDAYYCAGVDGVVDAVSDPACGIWYLGVEYANWAALVAAFPAGTIATDGSLPFVIAERTPAEPPALWRVNNVKLGKGGK